MSDHFTITSPSPDSRHTARLSLGGEIRFGPAYYALSVDDDAFGERIFGSPHLWSPASDMLAVQEWLTLDYSDGPITVLLLIDIRARRELALARANKGFVVPERFDGATLAYHSDYAGRITGHSVDLATLAPSAWQALARR